MRLEAVQGDGATLRVHLERLQKSTGQIDPRLAEVQKPLPPSLQVLWSVFVRLNDTRQGEAGIALREIEAYGRLHNIAFNPWEVESLLDIDRAWRSAAIAPQRKDMN